MSHFHQHATEQTPETKGNVIHWAGPYDALTNYILGVAAQNAENARSQVAGADRTAFLADVVRQWTRNDPARYPFVHSVAAQLRDHDDREQFLAGVDLILAGMDTLS